MRGYVMGFAGGLVLSAAAGLLLLPRSIEAQSATTRGAGEAGTVIEDVAWRISKKRAQQTKVQRLVMKVPVEYGRLVGTSGAEGSTLWFEDEEGTIRNVIIRREDVLVKIDREPPIQ